MVDAHGLDGGPDAGLHLLVEGGGVDHHGFVAEADDGAVGGIHAGEDDLQHGRALGEDIFLGEVLGAVKDNAINRQLEEQGYKIKDIHPSQEENFLYVIIVNYKGEEQTVIISKDELEAETLSVGDYVFLDEEGLLEKAYDDDEADE